jgi:hypothetical protein
MQPVQLQGTYLDLTTPHVADACMRLGIPVRCTRPVRGRCGAARTWSAASARHGTTAAST